MLRHDRILAARLVAAAFAAAPALPASGDPALSSEEPIPWSLLTDGGCEDPAGPIYTRAGAVRDTAEACEGAAAARVDLTEARPVFEVRLLDSHPVAGGSRHLLRGRLRPAFAGEGDVSVFVHQFRTKEGKTETIRSHRAARAERTGGWRPFRAAIDIAPEATAIRLSIVAKGRPGDRCWIDDLAFAPATVHLRWPAAAGAGLWAAWRGDGVSFEFPIPDNALVAAVFLDAKRLREGGAGDYAVLHPARVVRLFAIPPPGATVAVLLLPLAPGGRLAVRPDGCYALPARAGRPPAWCPAPPPGFRLPEADVAAILRESVAPPSAARLPDAIDATAPCVVPLTATGAGRYALVLRNAAGTRVRGLVDHRRLAAGETIRVPFDGLDDAGRPIPPGTCAWEVVQRPPDGFLVTASRPAPPGAVRMWRREGGWSFLCRAGEAQAAGKVIVRTAADFTPVGPPVPLPVADAGGIAEGRDGTLFVFDRAEGMLLKIAGGRVAEGFPREAGLFAKGQRVDLALDETHGAPALYAARSWEDRDRDDKPPPPALLKLGLDGAPAVSFGSGGAVGAPLLAAPTAVCVLPDGSLAVGESREDAWVVRLDAAGRPLARCVARRGRGLSDRFSIEDSEEAYAFLRGLKEKAGGIVDTRFRRVTGIRPAPGGGFLLAPGYVREASRELQAYDEAGVFLHDVGRGPQAAAAVHADNYACAWDTRGTDPYGDIGGFDFDAAGDLAIFDARAGRIDTVAAATAAARKPVRIAGTAPAARPPFPPLPPDLTLDRLGSRHALACGIADAADLGDENALRGYRDDGTCSVIRRAAGAPYRLAGAAHCAWFRLKLDVPHPGRPHLLVVRHPDDVHRWTMVAVRHEGEWVAGTGVDWLGVEGGYATGWTYPLTGGEQTYATTVTPRRPRLTLYFLTFAHGGLPACREHPPPAPLPPLFGAAASAVWLLEATGDLPRNPVEEPVFGERRFIGEHRQNPDTFFCDFGPAATERDAWRRCRAYHHRAWTARALDGFFAWSDWLGLNRLDTVAIEENGHRLYPSTVFRNDRKPHEDALRLTLDAAARHRTDVSVTFFGLVGFPPERPDLKDKGLVSERGQADTTRNMSLVYPEVRQYFLDLVLEPVRRCAGDPHFRGVTIMMQMYRPPMFGGSWSVDWGFEEASIRAFEQATGRRVEGADTTARAAFIKRHLREPWSAWRCGILRDWVLRVRDEVRKVRPDLLVALYPHVAGPDPRFYGYDEALFRGVPGVQVYRFPAETDLYPGLFTDPAAKWRNLKPEGMTDILEFGHGYFETRTTWHEQTAASLAPPRRFAAGPLAASLIRWNPRTILFHSWVRGTVGFELELREFVRAFRSLPWAPADELAEAVPETSRGRLRVFRFGNFPSVQYLAAVNTTEGPLAAEVAAPGAPAGAAVRDLVEGRDLAGRATGRGLAFPVEVPAGTLRTYRVGG